MQAERSFTSGLLWTAAAAVVLATAATFIILPLQRGVGEQAQAVSEKTIALARARAAMQRVRELEPAAAEARGRLSEFIARLGPNPVTSVQGLIQEHFRHAGFAGTVEDLEAVDEVPALRGYVRRHLRVKLTLRDEGDKVPAVLETAAALEQRSPLIRLEKFELQSTESGPADRQAVVDFSVLLFK